MTKPRLAFHLQTVQEYGIRRLVATVVRLTDDGIRNPSFNYTDPAADLADSKSPQPSAPTPPRLGMAPPIPAPQRPPRPSPGHEPSPRPHRTNPGHPTRPTRPPDNFHTYLLYVAAALNIHLFLLPNDQTRPPGSRLRQVDTLTVGDWIHHQERQYAGTSE